MTNCQLVAIPLVDVGLFDLHLPLPTVYNTGGYTVPSAQGVIYAYSPIDLLIAILEAKRLDLPLLNLQDFFYSRKYFMLSENEVYIVYKINETLYSHSILEIKIRSVENTDLFKVMFKNAPLTFRELYGITKDNIAVNSREKINSN
jgi:hypothetical protein